MWLLYYLCWLKLWKVWTQESVHKEVEHDCAGENSPEIIGLLLTVTDVFGSFAVVIFRVKVSCIVSVDGI